ncbi:MAG: hypothetical protein ACLPXB_01105 [Thiobacillaceae bacterium]
MKRNIISAAVAVACAGLASQALALAPTDLSSSTTSLVRISGSSATNNQLVAFAQDVCQSGTLNYLTTSDSNQFALFCQATSKIPVSKTNVVIIKNSNGGSGNGIGPIASGANFAFLDVFNASFNTSCGTATPVAATTEYIDPTNPGGGTQIALNGYNKYTCALIDNSTATPDLGVSDEEPALLVQAGAVTGVTAAQLATLQSKPLNVVIFGTQVTLTLRNALQTAQIASGALPGSCTVGNESEECMPSLTKGQMSSIFTGNAVSWTEFGLNNSSDNNIYIARRVISSGTQTGTRVFYLNDPCAPGMAQFLNANSAESITAATACSTATFGGATVYAGSGAGNVETCLDNHDLGGRWAVGVLGLENPAVGDTTSHMRPIKIDGISPTSLNVALGRWDFWTEASLNYVGTPSGDVGVMLNTLATDFDDPVVLRSVNSKFQSTNLLNTAAEPWATGAMAPATQVSTVPVINTSSLQTNLANVYQDPANYYTRSINGSPVNCQPAVTWFATGTNGNLPQ